MERRVRVGLTAPFRRENQGLIEQRILGGNVRYLNIVAFDWTNGVTSGVYDDAMRFLRDGDAIIIDVRQNAGGFPDAVHYLLSHFVEPNTLFVTFYEGTKATPLRSVRDLPAGRIKGKPIFVLTGPVTASAAEELAYQIANRKLGEVVGEPTAGAGNQSDVFPIAGGFVLSLSTARAIDAITNSNWEGVGVPPTIVSPVGSAMLIAHVRALEQLALSASTDDQIRLRWESRIARARVAPPMMTAAALARYVGSYGDRHVTSRDGTLYWKRGAQAEIEMQVLGDDWFLLGATGGQAHFIAENGRVTSVVISRPDGDGAAIPRSAIPAR